MRREREVVLYGPIRLVTGQALLWAVAAVLFAALNLQYGPRLGAQVGETILLGGIATCALVYLLTERILRADHRPCAARHPVRAPDAAGDPHPLGRCSGRSARACRSSA